MDAIARRVILSWGWRRHALAFAGGAVSALAQAPFHLFPILWLTFPLLVWLIDGAFASRAEGGVRRLRPAFAVGWWFGFGYFLAGLWWIGAAFLVDADAFGWALPFAVVLLPAGLALLWGAGVTVAQLLWSEGPARLFALAFGLSGAEWLRGHLLTGFPWNAIGYALAGGEAMMQSASLLGLYALNTLAVLVFAAPAALVPGDAGRRALLPAGLGLIAVAGLALFGAARLVGAGEQAPDGRTVRIVQPAIDQAEKWTPENRQAIFERLLALSSPADAPLEAGALLVWPETALPFALTREPWALSRIADLLPESAVLATGAARVDEIGGTGDVFNAIYLVGDDGTILDAYDKVHRVPFGEYVPFAGTWRRLGLGPLFDMRGSFAGGLRRRLLAAGDGPPFAPLICYEIIFPGEVVPDSDETRPAFLLNVTNDAWFGKTPGPYQHLHQARVRAVEEGVPLVRAANTGISMVTDAYGRAGASLGLGAAGRIDARLAAPLQPPFAARHALHAQATLLTLCLFAAIAGATRRRSLQWKS